MLENLKLGLAILLTGIVIVFSVLVLLILIIKVYSTLVYNAQNRISEKNSEKEKNEKVETAKSEPAAEKAEAAVVEEEPQEDDGTVPGEIVAAIAAAIEVIFGEGSVKIKSIKKSSKRRSVWKSAGVAENTRSF